MLSVPNSCKTVAFARQRRDQEAAVFFRRQAKMEAADFIPTHSRMLYQLSY